MSVRLTRSPHAMRGKRLSGAGERELVAADRLVLRQLLDRPSAEAPDVMRMVRGQNVVRAKCLLRAVGIDDQARAAQAQGQEKTLVERAFVANVADSPPGAGEGAVVPAGVVNRLVRCFAMKQADIAEASAMERLRGLLGFGSPIDEGAAVIGGIARAFANAFSLRHRSHPLSCPFVSPRWRSPSGTSAALPR